MCRTSSSFAAVCLVALALCSALPPSVSSKRAYSTKTAYADLFSPEQFAFINEPSNYRIDNCEPEQIFMFVRHGTRFPSSKSATKTRKFLEQAAAAADPKSDSKRLIEEMVVSFENVSNYALNELGAREMTDLAQRFAKRYPRLFASVSRSKAHLDVQSSSMSRALDSASTFLGSLFPVNVAASSNSKLDPSRLFDIRQNDRMLRAFDQCERYETDVKKNNTLRAELAAFEHGAEMKRMLAEFKARHNLNGVDMLDADFLSDLFSLCQSETALRMPVNWCRLFTQSDYETLAYASDLKAYLTKSSYGADISARIALPLLQDLVKNMANHISQASSTSRSISGLLSNLVGRRSSPRVLLRFGHAETMIPLVTALGLYAESDAQPLRADNYATKKETRNFRSGSFAPFAANLAVVLHKCSSPIPSASSSSSLSSLSSKLLVGAGANPANYKVMLLVNELPVGEIENSGKLACAAISPGMSTNAAANACTFDAFKRQLQSQLDLQFERECSPLIGNKTN